MLCFAPLVLVGYAMTIQTSWHRSQNVDGGMIELQTCEKGIGFDVKASTAGLYGIGAQYGWQAQFDKWSLTFQPKIGVSYVDHAVHELPQRLQFEVGAQLVGGYDRYRIGLEYWHLSNAGMRDPNIGVDLLVLQTGISF